MPCRGLTKRPQAAVTLKQPGYCCLHYWHYTAPALFITISLVTIRSHFTFWQELARH